jgi:hypothetical protein
MAVISDCYEAGGEKKKNPLAASKNLMTYSMPVGHFYFILPSIQPKFILHASEPSRTRLEKSPYLHKPRYDQKGHSGVI